MTRISLLIVASLFTAVSAANTFAFRTSRRRLAEKCPLLERCPFDTLGSATTSTPQSSDDSDSDAGLIAGGVLGGLAFIALVVVGLWQGGYIGSSAAGEEKVQGLQFEMKQLVPGDK